MNCLANLRKVKSANLALLAGLCLACTLLIVPPTATAVQEQKQEKEQEKEQEKSAPKGFVERERTAGLRQEVYEDMQEIQALIENDELVEARERIADMQEGKLNDYELAQTWYMLGYVHFQNEDYAAAQTAFERVLVNEELPQGLRTNVYRTLAQLSMLGEDYEQALTWVERLLEDSRPPISSSIFALKAQVHYQLEQFDLALEALDEAEQIEAAQGAPPKENWLLLKNAIYFQRGDLPAMLAVVQELVRLYPKDRYLLNMAAIYGELGDSEKQLSLMEPLYERGSLPTENHKINLASLYLLNEVPYKAAVLLAGEMDRGGVESNEKNLEMLSQAWLSAANLEAAVGPLAQAAELSEDGESYLALARILMTLTRWEEAEQAVADAIAAGGLRDTYGAWIMKGMTQYNQKHFRDARSSFARAGEDPANATLAQRWMTYLEREEEKYEMLNRD